MSKYVKGQSGNPRGMAGKKNPNAGRKPSDVVRSMKEWAQEKCPKAQNVLERALMSDAVEWKDRIRVALWLLEWTGGKAVQRHEVSGDTAAVLSTINDALADEAARLGERERP